MKFHSIIVVALLAGVAFAADEKPQPSKPAEPPASAVKVFAPTDLEALKAEKGKPVLVEGTVVVAGESKSTTVRYLNFTTNFRESVSLVFFAKDGGGTFTKEKLAEYVGKKVRVNGVLSEHQGGLQIKIESFDQVKVQP